MDDQHKKRLLGQSDKWKARALDPSNRDGARRITQERYQMSQMIVNKKIFLKWDNSEDFL